MAKTISWFLSFLLFSTISFPAYCQTSLHPDTSTTFRMSEVVISATRTRTPTIEVASSISVIGSDEISQSNGEGVLDLLRGQYGLNISQSGGPGQLAQMSMRGSDPGNVLVEIDGVRMNMPDDPSNSYDFSFLSLDNVERIEVLRGPQSTLYGSDAIAGVIKVITKRCSDKQTYFLNVEGGSLESYKGLIRLGGANGSMDYSIALSKTKSNGISSADQAFGNTETDGFQDYTVSSKLGWRVSDNADVDLLATLTAGKVGLDQHGGMYGDDPTYEYNHQQGAYSMEASIVPIVGWQQQFVCSFMRNLRTYNFDSTIYNPATSRSSYQGNTYQFNWQNNFVSIPRNLVTLGVEGYRQTSSSVDLYMSTVYGNFNSQFPEKSLSALSTYLQDQITLIDGYFATAGIRYDHYNEIGSSITYRVTQAYLIEKTGTKLRAVVGTGFKAPSLFGLYDPTYGNPRLKSEESLGWETGFEQYLRNSWTTSLSLGITYFDNKFLNMFGYDANFRTINVDKTETSGIEAYVTAEWDKSLKFSASYSYTDAVNKSPGSPVEGSTLIRRPKNSGSMRLNYVPADGVNVNFDVAYVGRRDDENFSFYPAKRVQLASYTLLNISSSLQLTQLVRLYGRIQNLANERYEDVYGYGTKGRAGYIGMNLTFF